MPTVANQTETVHTVPPPTRTNVALARWALYAIVFFSGAILMGVEIGGAKILAPGFGTSTYVWGSIIGLFMGALASGYYLGGKLADVRPAFTVLATIVSLAGIWIAIFIPYCGRGICDWVAFTWPHPVGGPLMAATAIFFVPSFLMGIVSPYAVKLSAGSLSELGGVAGRLYALSTFGSIVGTLFTTFVMISHVSLSHVMLSLGLALMLVAIVSLGMFHAAAGQMNRKNRTGLGVMALIALICAETWLVFPVEPCVAEGCRLLSYEDSPYHEVSVAETVIQNDNGEHVLLPVNDVGRWLKFNENTESGIYPYRAVYTNAVGYTDMLHLPLLWVHDPAPKKILVVGCGGSIVPTQYFDMYGTEVDVAELDPAVERVAKTYFQVPKTDKIHYFIGDGRQTVRNKLKDGSYDVIVLDAYSSGGQIPFHLLTWEFLNEVKRKLTPRGVLATNIISGIKNVSAGSSIRPADLFLAEYKTLTASRVAATGQASDKKEDNEPLFSQIYVFPRVHKQYPLVPNGYEDYRNVIVVATREEKRMSQGDLEHEVAVLEGGEHPVLRIPNLALHVGQLYEPSASDFDKNIPVLTDDFAPVDLMYRPVRADETLRRLGWY